MIIAHVLQTRDWNPRRTVLTFCSVINTHWEQSKTSGKGSASLTRAYSSEG